MDYDAKYGWLAIGGGVAVCGAIAIGAWSESYSLAEIEKSKAEVEKAKIERSYALHEANLTGNPTPEKFYIIDKNIAVIEIDGKPIVSSPLETKLLEKED